MKNIDNILIAAIALVSAPVIFSIFFLAMRSISAYILTRNQKQNTDMQTIEELIRQTKGRFFTIKFRKKDGTVRIINSKNKYFRLIRGTGSPAIKGLRKAGYLSAVNRNRESWFSFKPSEVIEFKSGNIHQTF